MENLAKRPSKGILKSSSSIERQDSKLTRQNSHDKDIKWDEMNILQTLHPPDKDYGHMKIEEPKTPYSYYNEENEEINSDNEQSKEIDPDNLADLINKKAKSAFSFDEDPMEKSETSGADEEEEDWDDLTEEEKEKRHDFESKRKKHYNEFQMVKLARKLMKDELEEVGEEDNSAAPSASSSSTAAGKSEPASSTQTTQGDDISKA